MAFPASERAWDKIWNDYYKPITQEQAADWTAELRQQFGNLTGQELCRAVRWMAGRKGYKWPKLGDLVEAINTIRQEDDERNGRTNDTTAQFINQQRVDQAEQAMVLAADHDDRWEILCTTCRTKEECDVVHAWAAGQWPDWIATTSKIRQWIAREIGRTARQIGSVQTED